MLKRFFKRESHGPSGPVARVDVEDAANHAIAALDDGSACISSDATSLCTVQSVAAILALPSGDRRCGIAASLEATIMKRCPNMCANTAASIGSLFQSLREGPASEELAVALSISFQSLVNISIATRPLEALTHDEDPTVAAECSTSASTRAGVATKLAILLRESISNQVANTRVEDSLRSNLKVLDRAQVSLQKLARDVETKGDVATAAKNRLAGEIASLNCSVSNELLPDSHARTAVELETHVYELDQRKREVKLELERLSRQHEEIIARQKAHMSQVDCWRLDKEGVKAFAMKSRERAISTTSAVQAEHSICESLLENVRGAQSSFQQEQEPHGQSVLDYNAQNIMNSAELLVSAADDWLSAALSVADSARTEHDRAKSTIQLLELQLGTNELPSMTALTQSLETLSDAWAARVTLGNVDLTRRAEIEFFLREASDGHSHSKLAAAKQSWARHWGGLGDVSGPIADATAATTEISVNTKLKVGFGELANASDDGSKADKAPVTSRVENEVHDATYLPSCIRTNDALPTPQNVFQLPFLDDDCELSLA